VVSGPHDFAMDAVTFHRCQEVPQQLVGRARLIS
jgi:hypothetical protein